MLSLLTVRPSPWIKRTCCAIAVVLVAPSAAFAQTATPPPQTPAADVAPATTVQKILLSPYMEYEVVASAPSLPSVGSVFSPNSQVASFMIAPKVTAITKVASAPRPRAFPQSLPAGTAMFQVQVDSGVAYCAFWGATQGVRETQCFRDLNSDGTFDASYLTYNPLVGKSLYVGRMARLAAMPGVAYEVQAQPSGAPEPFSYRFLRVRNGIAEFKPQFIADRRGFAVIKCNLSAAEPCALGLVDYVFSESGGSLTVTSATPVERRFVLYAERPE